MTTGTKYQTYYGNGKKCGVVTVSRTTDKSIFVISSITNNEHREGINSVKRYISKGLWEEIK